MKKHFDDLRKLLLDFIEQRDNLMLVLACPPAEAALALKVLLDHQASCKDDLFYLFPEDFPGAAPYVEGIIGRMKREYDASVESATPEVGPLPPLPSACLSASATPLARFHAALGYARGLIPAGSGHRVVFGLGPAEIANLSEYVALLIGCTPQPKIEPWMRGLRMIVRVSSDFSEKDPLAQAPRVTFRRFIIPPDAAESGLKEIAQDKRMPDLERMTAQLQLSFIDAAHDRLDVATAGFRAALATFQEADDKALQALAMLGLADCSKRAKDIEKAKYWYECAIVPAGETKQLMILATIAQNLGHIAFEGKKYGDAAEYYEQWVIAKKAIPDEDGLVEALLWRGRAQEKASQAEAALASWDEAMIICRSFELEHREEECLAQLRQGYTSLGRAREGEAVVADWKNAAVAG